MQQNNGHHFKLVPGSKHDSIKLKISVLTWKCNGCNSECEFASDMSENEVNKRMDLIPKFPCLPPV
jgi:hypothetical protein